MKPLEQASSPMLSAVGFSRETVSTQAAIAAADMALSKLDGAEPHFALVFASSVYDHSQLLGALAEKLPNVPLIGGTTAGEIVATGLLNHSCVIVLFHAPAVKMGIGIGENAGQEPLQAGRKVAYGAAKNIPQNARKLMLLLSDGLMGNSSDWIRGLQEALGAGCPIVGGLCGDDLSFTRTSQFHQEKVYDHSLVGALFSGPIQVGIGMTHGFLPISKPRRITKSQAHVLMELDNKTATSVYTEYFGEERLANVPYTSITRQGVAYPLGIQHDGSNEWILRNVLNYTEDGCLVCNDTVPDSTWMQVMISSRSMALDAVRNAARSSIENMAQVSCALMFISFSRIKLMGTAHVEHEIAAARHLIGANVPFAGLVTYGEVAPIVIDGLPQNLTAQSGCSLLLTLGSELS